MDDSLVKPIIDPFLQAGLLGAAVVVEGIVIAYLFRLLMKSHEIRVSELKEESKAHEAATKEMTTIVSTNNAIMLDVKALLASALTRK